MGLEVVAEHTVDWPIVGPVLDVGARRFTFSREMMRRDLEVYAVEPDPTVNAEEGIQLIRKALVGRGEAMKARFLMAEDPQARRLDERGGVEVECVTIGELSASLGVPIWGCVKLDCEGAEYGILKSWPGPIARQISVEFHEHVCPKEQYVYDSILAHLGRWYDVVQHEKSLRHCLATPNYWDSLFLLRDETMGRTE